MAFCRSSIDFSVTSNATGATRAESWPCITGPAANVHNTMSRHLKRMVGIVVLVVVGLIAIALLVRRFEPRFAFYPFAGENRTPEDFDVPFTSHTIETADGER